MMYSQCGADAGKYDMFVHEASSKILWRGHESGAEAVLRRICGPPQPNQQVARLQRDEEAAAAQAAATRAAQFPVAIVQQKPEQFMVVEEIDATMVVIEPVSQPKCCVCVVGGENTVKSQRWLVAQFDDEYEFKSCAVQGSLGSPDKKLSVGSDISTILPAFNSQTVWNLVRTVDTEETWYMMLDDNWYMEVTGQSLRINRHTGGIEQKFRVKVVQ